MIMPYPPEEEEYVEECREEDRREDTIEYYLKGILEELHKIEYQLEFVRTNTDRLLRR